MGLWTVHKETEKLEPFSPETINCGVRALLPTRDGGLYIGSEKGLFIYRNNQLERLAVSSDILSAENFIVALNLDENGALWILTKGGLHSMNISNRKITSYPYKQGFSYRNMTRIGKKLYLGTMGCYVLISRRVNLKKILLTWVVMLSCLSPVMKRICCI